MAIGGRLVKQGTLSLAICSFWNAILLFWSAKVAWVSGLSSLRARSLYASRSVFKRCAPFALSSLAWRSQKSPPILQVRQRKVTQIERWLWTILSQKLCLIYDDHRPSYETKKRMAWPLLLVKFYTCTAGSLLHKVLDVFLASGYSLCSACLDQLEWPHHSRSTHLVDPVSDSPMRSFQGQSEV